MKIKFNGVYKSVRKDMELDLKDFTVITGKNGSGKTNLLRAINAEGVALIDGKASEELVITFFNYNYFQNQIEKTYGSTSYGDSAINLLWKEINSSEPNSEPTNRQLEILASHFGKQISELTEDDFKSYPMNRSNEELGLLGLNYFQDTASYLDHKEKNILNHFRNTQYGENNLVFTADEFIEKYGAPPWETINQIFLDTGLNYEFIEPDLTRRRPSIASVLIDKINNTIVDVNEMSTGEKTILAMAAFFYNADIIAEIPDVFLFDEPDALLHPEFSKKLVYILNDYIVGKLKKKVIMTTHSPSTVAIVPDDCIFICEKKSFKARPATKDEALNNLTQNINSLSILHENRKQVFVEDDSDAYIFEFLENMDLLTTVDTQIIKSCSIFCC